MLPSAIGLNKLLRLCKTYTDGKYVKISASKTVCMWVLPNKIRLGKYAIGHIGAEVVKYVTELRYLGHITTKVRSLYYRGNALVRNFFLYFRAESLSVLCGSILGKARYIN